MWDLNFAWNPCYRRLLRSSVNVWAKTRRAAQFYCSFIVLAVVLFCATTENVPVAVLSERYFARR